jgi:hypothetical protein
MLYATPFTERKQVQLVQPFVHCIAERTIEVAIKKVSLLNHSAYSPLKPALHVAACIDREQRGSNDIHYRDWLSSFRL